MKKSLNKFFMPANRLKLKPRLNKPAITVALSFFLFPTTSFSQIIDIDYAAVWTMLKPNGEFSTNTSVTTNSYDGNRTDITGTMSYDTLSGAATFTITPFMLSGATVTVEGMFMEDVGSNLRLGNFNMNWDGNVSVPVSLVWDATGLVNAVSAGLSSGNTIMGGAIPASSNTVLSSGPFSIIYPLGPSFLSTTTWDTSPVAPPVVLGSNPSGGIPLVADLVADVTNGDIGIGGSPMQTNPFLEQSINIDFNGAVVTNVSAVPIPSAVWLFGSGLLGVVGMARRKA